MKTRPSRSVLIPTLAIIGLASGCIWSKSDDDDDSSYFTDMACEYEPWDWMETDLVSMVMKADNGGDFAFNPDVDSVDERSGNYSFDDGDFTIENEYDSDYYLTESRLEGYGTVYPNGDADLLYKIVTEDILDDEWATRVRLERDGCDASLQMWSMDVDGDIEQAPQGDPDEWEVEIRDNDEIRADLEFESGSLVYDYRRTWQDDQSIHTTWEADDGSFVGETTFFEDGTGEGLQEYYDSDYDQTIEITYNFDGSNDVDNEVYEDGEKTQDCEYQVSYAGEGEGTCTFSDLECDLSFDLKTCELDCDGDTYDC